MASEVAFMSQECKKTMLRCPQCGKLTFWEDNRYRPFCSARCRVVDLGAWIDEDYRLPTQETPSHDDPMRGEENS